MTQEEAKQRWCPFARAANRDDKPRVGVNRTGYEEDRGRPDHDCMCLASGCMAWLLFSPLNDDDGYCGLAGRPERSVRRPDDGDDE